MRDLVLDVPVFWIVDPTHIIACLITAAIMFFVAPVIASRHKQVLLFDALGLALVIVVGTVKGLEADTGPLIAFVMGVTTASVGGIIRDVVGGEQSIIMRREIYVTAAVAGGVTYIGLEAIGFGGIIAAIASFITTFIIRGLAITYNWSLPTRNTSR